MERSQVVGIMGAGALALGVFAPLGSPPIFESQTLFGNGAADGTIVLAAATIAFFLSLRRTYRWLLLPGFAALAVVVWDVIAFLNAVSAANSQIADDMAGNPFARLGAVAAGAKQLKWGWAVLGIGIGLVIGASILGWGGQVSETTANTKRCPFCGKEIVVEAIQCEHCGKILKG